MALEIMTSWKLEGIEEGRIMGRQAGIEEGRQEGRQEGESSLVLRLLRRRFGSLPEELEIRVRALPVERLEALGEALLDFGSLADAETWLAQPETPSA